MKKIIFNYYHRYSFSSVAGKRRRRYTWGNHQIIPLAFESFVVNFIFLGDVKYSCLVVGFFVLKVFFRDITKIKKFRDGS